MLIRDDIVNMLNRALDLDSLAMDALFRTRVLCNEALAEDPRIQVLSMMDKTSVVGIVGILNSLFPVENAIRMEIDEDTNRLERFV